MSLMARRASHRRCTSAAGSDRRYRRRNDDANESGLALETLSEMLLESGAVISGETLADISSLVDEIGLDQVNVDRLRCRVEG